MKSPIEILHEIDRLKTLHEHLKNSDQSGVTAAFTIHRLAAKIEALEWVLAEKP